MTFETDWEDFRREALRKMAQAALTYAKPKVPSRTLRRAMTVFVGDGFAAVRIPHYWAVYIHDGTRSLLKAPTTQGKGVYLWYPNKADDPRTLGGTSYPIRYADTRRLTEKDYQDGLRRNRARRKRGMRPFMVVVRSTPSGHPHPGARFFDNAVGMAGFRQVADDMLIRGLNEFVRRQLPNDRGTLRVPI